MNFPLASLARPPARHPHGGGLSCAVRRAALHQHGTSPPPRRSGLRFSSPVGHGRGLATRPGGTGPGEGTDSASLRYKCKASLVIFVFVFEWLFKGKLIRFLE